MRGGARRETPVSINEARAIWDNMENPNFTRVARALWDKYGQSVSPTTIKRWYMGKWDKEIIEANNFARMAKNAEKIAKDNLRGMELSESTTDGNLIRQSGRQGIATAMTFFRMLRANAEKLTLEKPKEAASLLLAASRVCTESVNLYERNIVLAERAMKVKDQADHDSQTIDGTAVEETANLPVSASEDMLATNLSRLRGIAQRIGVKTEDDPSASRH